MGRLRRRLIAVIVAIYCVSLSSVPLEEKKLYLLPIVNSQIDPSSLGLSYAWPYKSFILQNKNGENKYITARISAGEVNYLNSLFKPELSEIIKIVNGKNNSWGLAIPGGEPRDSYASLLEPMLEYFTACLGSLEQDDLFEIEMAIYSPASFFSVSGFIRNERVATVTSKMLDNFRSNLCNESKSEVNLLLQHKSRSLLQAALTGVSSEIMMVDLHTTVFINIFEDLFFSPFGIWRKVTLKEIKNFVTPRIEKFPEITDLSWMKGDYESFLDFVALNRENTLLSKNQYKSIAAALRLDQADQLFDKFSLQQLVESKKISVVNLYLGSKASTHFLPGVIDE